MTAEEASACKRALAEQLRAGGFDSSRLYENAFDDMTDFEWVCCLLQCTGPRADKRRNPTFIYVC
jgi:hypothetical protein